MIPNGDGWYYLAVKTINIFDKNNFLFSQFSSFLWNKN